MFATKNFERHNKFFGIDFSKESVTRCVENRCVRGGWTQNHFILILKNLKTLSLIYAIFNNILGHFIVNNAILGDKIVSCKQILNGKHYYHWYRWKKSLQELSSNDFRGTLLADINHYIFRILKKKAEKW